MRHQIPTHLHVADRAFAGLTMRQLLSAAVGLALAYGASDLPVPIAMRLIAAALVLAGTALLVFCRPAGRPAEDWAFVLLRFCLTQRVAVWRPRRLLREPRLDREVVVPSVPRQTASRRRQVERGFRGLIT